MNNNVTMILLIFGLLVFIPVSIVTAVILTYKYRRNQKKKLYSGITKGRIDKIKYGGLRQSDVIFVTYCVDGVEYHIKETAKLKIEAIRIGRIPIGQRKTYRLGNISEGDAVTVQYDQRNPERAIIAENDGAINA